MQRVKHVLRRIDSRIIDTLSSDNSYKVPKVGSFNDAYRGGDSRATLMFINEYDQAILTRLVAQSPKRNNALLLKKYSAIKGKLHNGIRKSLSIARKMKSRVKHDS